MQTFLPYANYVESARVLDNKRLGKQRVENVQILSAIDGLIRGESRGWQNHPAVKMWRYSVVDLMYYHQAIVGEWLSRGYQDTRMEAFNEIFNGLFPILKGKDGVVPPSFVGWEPFHASHRSNLLRKNPDHYGQFGWEESDDLPYIWPSP